MAMSESKVFAVEALAVGLCPESQKAWKYVAVSLLVKTPHIFHLTHPWHVLWTYVGLHYQPTQFYDEVAMVPAQTCAMFETLQMAQQGSSD